MPQATLKVKRKVAYQACNFSLKAVEKYNDLWCQKMMLCQIQIKICNQIHNNSWSYAQISSTGASRV